MTSREQAVTAAAHEWHEARKCDPIEVKRLARAEAGIIAALALPPDERLEEAEYALQSSMDEARARAEERDDAEAERVRCVLLNALDKHRATQARRLGVPCTCDGGSRAHRADCALALLPTPVTSTERERALVREGIVDGYIQGDPSRTYAAEVDAERRENLRGMTDDDECDAVIDRVNLTHPPQPVSGALRAWFSRVLTEAAGCGLVVSQDERGVDVALERVGPPPETGERAAREEGVRDGLLLAAMVCAEESMMPGNSTAVSVTAARCETRIRALAPTPARIEAEPRSGWRMAIALFDGTPGPVGGKLLSHSEGSESEWVLQPDLQGWRIAMGGLFLVLDKDSRFVELEDADGNSVGENVEARWIGNALTWPVGETPRAAPEQPTLPTEMPHREHALRCVSLARAEPTLPAESVLFQASLPEREIDYERAYAVANPSPTSSVVAGICEGLRRDAAAEKNKGFRQSAQALLISADRISRDWPAREAASLRAVAEAVRDAAAEVCPLDGYASAIRRIDLDTIIATALRDATRGGRS